MGCYIILHLFGFLFWVLFFMACFGQNNAAHEIVQGTVIVNGDFPINSTTDDDGFVCATLDWWPPDKCDYGTCSWGLSSILNLNLSDPILQNAVRAFSPLKLRLGGSLQNKVIYDIGDPGQPCTQFARNSSQMFGFTQGCLPMWRWDELNNFFEKTGAVVVFGLNALNGRVRLSDGSFGGPWNSTNAAALIRYTVDRGYKIHGWELGNELSGSGVGARVGANQYARDVIALNSIINNIYRDFPVKPLVLAPGGFFDARWFRTLVNRTRPNALDVVTHHIYNLGPGVDPHLVEKILDPLYLNRIGATFRNLQEILRSSGTRVVSWVGEAGGAYNSGGKHISNAFVSSFWFVDQLGMSATYDTKTYCRQTLVGGNYGLLNTTTFKPNPDYYSALLWHRLMGRNVLSTTFKGTNKIRAYAHCARETRGITLVLINLDGNTTAQVIISSEPAFIISMKRYRRRKLKKKSTRVHRIHKTDHFTREEYHLTAQNGNLHSQRVLLNGEILDVDQNGKIPELEPIRVNASEFITVAPFSIVFAHVPYFYASACN